ncbi:MAG TPA: NAD-dependent epimerase [Burkholderiales bacterium]|nr:NAD-dependent epimerase [Burkholderiales bacterium]
MKVLVTGAAGFIGMHVVERLLARGDEVVGLDNLNDYYEVALKEARLARLTGRPGFSFVRADVADRAALAELFSREAPARVVHLAAQAGVRYSLTHPEPYVQSNLVGFANILEACRRHAVAHLVYASSSSVYGGNVELPFAEDQPVDHPVSLYAATKRANELMAHTYSHLYGLPTSGLRYFTVYGPWGRPDMTPFLFAGAILRGEAIDVFNHGCMQRDFTYVDDIVESTLGVLDRPPAAAADFDRARADPGRSWAPYRVLNVGNHDPVELMDYIRTLEQATGKTAALNMKPMQPGDVIATYADTTALRELIGTAPATPLARGIGEFVRWYRQYYRV